MVQVPLFPKFRLGLPLGQPIFLNSVEYRDIMLEKDDHERKWKRHLLKLVDKKKPENGRYEIKTPIPSHPDRCFVCQSAIPEDVTYKQHIASPSHLALVNRDPLYLEIDSLIDEMNAPKVSETPLPLVKPAKRRGKRQLNLTVSSSSIIKEADDEDESSALADLGGAGKLTCE